jgi:hypothetical protein
LSSWSQKSWSALSAEKFMQRSSGHEVWHFAYWAKEWWEDYKKYIDRAAKLGFAILEISCASLKDQYVSDFQLLDLRDYAYEY